MRQVRIIPYLGPALIIYLIAGVISIEGEVDAVGMAIAATAAALSVAASWRTWRGADMPGSRRIMALGLCASLALVGAVRPNTVSLTIIVAQIAGLCGFGSLLIELARSIPERPGRFSRSRVAAALPYLCGAAAAIAGLAAIAPAIALFGAPWLFSSRLILAPPLFAGLSVLLALAVRLSPRGPFFTPEAIASNSWAVMGLIPAALVAAALGAVWLAGWADPQVGWRRAMAAAAAVAVVIGHIFLVVDRYRLSAGRFARGAAAAGCALALTAAIAAAVPARIFEEPASAALAVTAMTLVGALAFRASQPLVWRGIAPAGGRLLEAVDKCIEQMAYAYTLEDLARAVLGPLRRASGRSEADPLLYVFSPLLEARIDAAGMPHIEARVVSPALSEYLTQRRGEIVLRDPLEASIVRQPPLRPLVETLVNLDALCVVPLLSGDDLEGALLVPKGARKSAVALEEIEALRRLSRWLAGYVTILSALSRAQQRSADLAAAQARSEEKIGFLEKENASVNAEVRVLKTGKSVEALSQPQVAYSPSMRALMDRIREIAPNDAPALLVAEGGIPLEPVAYLLHGGSGRARQAFVIGDCAATGAEQCGKALFGEKDGAGDFPGWLRLAQEGSLLLLDLLALPREVQRTLGWAMATRQAHCVDGDAPYSIDVRIIATSRVEPAKLLGSGLLDAELGKRLGPGTLRVPPLRERAEDLPSLVLLELNRASRVLGREPVGIEPAALQRLQNHLWPGNLDELRSVIERAVQATRGARVNLSDLPELGIPSSSGAEKPELLSGTFEAVERRVLEQALNGAGGNKSQAARMLGLKRTTFIDKLKRYRIEDDKPPASG